MILHLGNETDTTVTAFYECEGCNDQVIVKVDQKSGFDSDDARTAVQDLGWRRRFFIKEVEPWFCCEECAYNSPNAKHWAKIWKVK